MYINTLENIPRKIQVTAKELNSENYTTGHPCLMIPDFAIAMLSNEPPNAAKCSSPIDVITDVASSVLHITFVASLAPPRPACSAGNDYMIILLHTKRPLNQKLSDTYN